MARLFVPELGTVLTLAENWTFKVINESRNAGLAALMNPNVKPDYYYPFGTMENDDITADSGWYGRRRVPIDPGNYTWPAGTNLEVDRIYVRKGNEEFSSITFKTRVNGKQVRFFARLEDVNKIVF